ncbi:MAG: hypothetical protein Q9191_004812 [Dirinaria sp. TL-2023a]
MADNNFYLLPPLNTLPVENPHEWIGRIVKSYGDPGGNFTPVNVPAHIRQNIRDDGGFCSLEQIIESQKGRSLGASLAEILKFSVSHTQVDTPEFYSPKVRRLKLQQEDRNRQTILALEEVKAHLKEWHTLKHPVYLIVGVLVADHIGYAEKSRTKKSHELGLNSPGELASLAAGLPIPVPDVVDFNLANSAEHRRETMLTAVGTRIFAIEYRVLTKRFLSTSGKIDVRPGGIRGERTFSDDTKPDVGLDTENHQSEVVADPDPLPDVIEEAEEWCFDVYDDENDE